MKITDKGFELSTLSENVQVFADKLKRIFGDDFVIEKEGVTSNVAVASSASIMDLENQIAYLIRMMNPRTTEGVWQDNLYSIIGLPRRQATYTILTRTVSGTAGYTIEAGALTFENKATKDQFVNVADTTIGSNGTALVTFKALESGAVDLDSEAALNIVTPLEGVESVYCTPENSIIIGVDYENNEEFRKRWEISSVSATSNTDDGLYRALLELVEAKSDLNIIQNRSGEAVNDIPAHSIKIVINSPYDDHTIGDIIANKIVDGNQAGTVGSTSVTVTDSMGSPMVVRFQRAETLIIYLNVKIEVSNRSAMAQIQADVKNNILKYIDKNKFDMGSKIWANIFTTSIYEVDGVSAITELKISSNGSDWRDFIQLGSEQVPSFASERISVYEAQ